jgi:hypothetical protein
MELNNRQKAFLSANPHLVSLVLPQVGEGLVVCYDIGLDDQGQRYGPYVLDAEAHLQVYTCDSYMLPPPGLIHDHISELLYADRNSGKKHQVRLWGVPGTCTVVYVQENRREIVMEVNDTGHIMYTGFTYERGRSHFIWADF